MLCVFGAADRLSFHSCLQRTTDSFARSAGVVAFQGAESVVMGRASHCGRTHPTRASGTQAPPP